MSVSFEHISAKHFETLMMLWKINRSSDTRQFFWHFDKPPINNDEKIYKMSILFNSFN